VRSETSAKLRGKSTAKELKLEPVLARRNHDRGNRLSCHRFKQRLEDECQLMIEAALNPHDVPVGFDSDPLGLSQIGKYYTAQYTGISAASTGVLIAS
jgi:hypothetical protein